MEAGRFEIIDYLGVFNTSELSQGFEFDDDRFETNKIRFVESSQLGSFVEDRQFDLGLGRYIAYGQFKLQGFLINGLKKTAS